MNLTYIVLAAATILIAIINEAESVAPAYGDDPKEHEDHCRYTVKNRGSRRNRKCAFPFRFEGKLFEGICTNITDPDGEFWCSTRVDKKTRKHVGGRGHWGYCKPGCDVKPVPKVELEIDDNDIEPATRTAPKPFKTTARACSQAKYDNTYWRQSKRGLASTEGLTYPDFFHKETTNGTYLPNEEDGTCGASAAFGQIVCPRGQDCNSKQGAYPFIAALGYKRKVNKKWVTRYACGGTLINRRYVITAAHCQGEDRRNQISEVVLGDYDLSKDPDCNEEDGACWKPVQRFYVTEDDITVHEYWNPLEVVREGYDIALIRLPELAYTIREICDVPVLPICMPWGKLPSGKNMDLPEGPKGKEYTVMGWGRTNNVRGDFGDKKEAGAYKSILQKLALPHIAIGWCRSNPKWRSFHRISEDRQVCAGGKTGPDAGDSCAGDSGGPLMVQSDEEGPMYLRGIVSFGKRKCNTGFPGVYTDISYYIDWIKENMKP